MSFIFEAKKNEIVTDSIHKINFVNLFLLNSQNLFLSYKFKFFFDMDYDFVFYNKYSFLNRKNLGLINEFTFLNLPITLRLSKYLLPNIISNQALVEDAWLYEFKRETTENVKRDSFNLNNDIVLGDNQMQTTTGFIRKDLNKLLNLNLVYHLSGWSIRDIDYYKFNEVLNYDSKLDVNNHFLLSVIDYSNLLVFLIYFLGQSRI